VGVCGRPLEDGKMGPDLGRGWGVHSDNDEAFRGACANGHLETAKWLLTLGGVNVHAINDDAFRYACGRGHLEIAKWLYTLGGVNVHADNNKRI
jgi:hypothetical protein